MSDYEDMSASEVIADLHGEGYRHPDDGRVWDGEQFLDLGAYDSGTPCDGTGVEPAPAVTPSGGYDRLVPDGEFEDVNKLPHEGLPGDGWVRYIVDAHGDVNLQPDAGTTWNDTDISADYCTLHPDPAPPRPTEGWQMPAPEQRGTYKNMPRWWAWSLRDEGNNPVSYEIEPTEEAALAAQAAARAEWDRKLTEHNEGTTR